MRFNSRPLVLGAALLVSLSGSALLAQDQSQPGPLSAATTTSPEGQGSYQGHRHAPNPHRQAKMMAKRLGLSEDQQKSLEPILADRMQQMESARADTSLAPQDRRAKMKGINQDSDARIEAVLNDTQKQQYEQMKQERRAHHHHENQQNGAPTPNS